MRCARNAEQFLELMQALIFNNDMTSTYKLALIRSILRRAVDADPLAVSDGNECVCISFDALAEEFLQLYWHMRERYCAGDGTAEVLVQVSNQRPNLRIYRLIEAFLSDEGLPRRTPFTAARRAPGFPHLVSDCKNQVVVKNPLAYIRGYEFLFEIDKKAGCVRVARNTALWLGRFYPILMELIESRWEAVLRSIRQNRWLLGNGSEETLRDFLFNPGRNEDLSAMRRVLEKAQGAQTCFYCGRPFSSGKTPHADHFVPYSRYRDTKTFNFVLACHRCNCSKSDQLAAGDHVGDWMTRNRTYAQELCEASHGRFESGILLTAQRAYSVYRDAVRNGELGWERAGELRKVVISQATVNDLERYVRDMGALAEKLEREKTVRT